MKRVLCVILVLMLVLMMSPTGLATEEEMVRLSDLSETECITFLKENDVAIPQIFEDEETWGFFVHQIIAQVEENPNVYFCFSNTMLLNFAYEIKATVNTYYGVGDIALCDHEWGDESVLVDSVLHGVWDDAYGYYNGYAYVLGETQELDPGFSTFASQGYDISEYDYDCYISVSTLANLVQADLVYLGYTVNSVTTTMPNTTIDEHTHLICFRIDINGMPWYFQDGVLVYYHDYYFMKLGENGKWYHKPQNTNPLEYKYTPSNDRIWYYESYDGVTGYRNDEWSFESQIYFIKYTTPHIWEFEYCGNGQHIKTCAICAGTNGAAINCVYKNGSDICSMCGNFDDYIAINRSKILPLHAE